MPGKITVTLGGMLIASVMFAAPVEAISPVDLSNPAFAPVSGPTSIPMGADDFCHRTNYSSSSGSRRPTQAGG